ncbi:MAG: nucleotidyltransferase [Lachnospiraceae bacterium]|nr:nucleotidyltransferase [Lachnospiraceae bacterium]
MKIAGIVAEYNPFHNGHQYHIEETRIQTGADYVIAVMSGDFVQRGAPAFLDKYDRAYAALAGGCDLVLELPVIYSSASAEFFAAGAVHLLHGLGVCDYLSFGSEAGNLESFLPIAEILADEPEEYQQKLRSFLKSGLSFPAAREKALEEYLLNTSNFSRYRSLSAFLKGSNNILALEYLKALKNTGSDIMPVTIRRRNASYHDKELRGHISSASAIRHHLLGHADINNIQASVPETTFSFIQQQQNRNGFPDLDHLTPYLHSALIENRDPSLYLDWDEDLANRLYGLPWASMSFTQIADKLKSRNVTHSRIHRALLHFILRLEKEPFLTQFDQNPVPYARILGFRRNSSTLLKEISRKGTVPIITKPASIHGCLNQANSWVWNTDLAASRLYQSIQFQYFHQILPSAYERSPIIF